MLIGCTSVSISIGYLYVSDEYHLFVDQVTLEDDLWPHLVELILSEGDVFLCGCHLQFVDLGLEVYFRQSNFKYM